MRLCQIHSELNAIKRQLRLGKRQISQEQLQRYATDGTLPEDPLTLAYVRLTESATAMIDSTIGGEDHDSAVDAYQRALEQYNNAVRGVSL